MCRFSDHRVTANIGWAASPQGAKHRSHFAFSPFSASRFSLFRLCLFFLSVFPKRKLLSTGAPVWCLSFTTCPDEARFSFPRRPVSRGQRAGGHSFSSAAHQHFIASSKQLHNSSSAGTALRTDPMKMNPRRSAKLHGARWCGGRDVSYFSVE